VFKQGEGQLRHRSLQKLGEFRETEKILPPAAGILFFGYIGYYRPAGI